MLLRHTLEQTLQKMDNCMILFSNVVPMCKNKILFVDLGISLPYLLFVGLNIYFSQSLLFHQQMHYRFVYECIKIYIKIAPTCFGLITILRELS